MQFSLGNDMRPEQKMSFSHSHPWRHLGQNSGIAEGNGAINQNA